jgi:Pvc16 N-terminal domain
MSNFLAIATVTAALKELLQDATVKDVEFVNVTTKRPDSAANASLDPKINIYLYQVTPNATWRNADLPTRRSDGTFIQRPQAALDLHYMISFYGDEDQLLTQRLLGSVVRTLHAHPILTRDRIRATIKPPQIDTATGRASDTFQYLALSNLADQVELVKFTPLHLSLEELSKIWSIFFQIPYGLSVAYQGSVVLIESEDEPMDVLPVRRRNIYVAPFHQPNIEKISTSVGDNQPITIDSILYILGKNLKGDVTLVQVGGIDVVPLPGNISNVQIVLPLAEVEKNQVTQPPGHLQAGVRGIQVIQPMLIGVDSPDKPLEAHRGVESNAMAFVLRPTITGLPSAGAAGSGEVTVTVNPAVGRTQRAVLLLNEISPAAGQSLDHPAQFFRSDQRIIKAGDPDPNNTLTFSFINVSTGKNDVSPGTYLVRVQVDGAESLLDVSTVTDPKSPLFNTYSNSPQVTIV